MSTKSINFIILLVAVFVCAGYQSAHADTYVGGINNDIYTTVNINKNTYSPSEPIGVTTSVAVTGSTPTPITLTAATTNNPLLTIISQTVNAGTVVYANGTLTAPASAGAYAVNFETAADEVEFAQNYSYSTNGGAIMGVCDVVVYPGGGDPT
jgi:predicted outer membrane repeat protein